MLTSLMRAVLSIGGDSVNTRGEFALLGCMQLAPMHTLVSIGLMSYIWLLAPLNHLPP